MSSQSPEQPSSKNPHKSKIPRLVSSSHHQPDDMVSLDTAELVFSKPPADSSTSEAERCQGQADGTPLLYTCVKDYDPLEFSRSGKPHLELPLKSGDVVSIFGNL